MSARSIFARWLFFADAVFVGSIQAVTISPVRVELSASRRVVSVTVSNPSSQAISFQAETLIWRQQGGTDRYEPTDDLLVAPPIAEIPPQSSQIFRVTLRRPLSGIDEQAYRLVLEDVSETLTPQPGAIAIRFNHNLPVFALSAGEAKALPRWSRCAAAAGKGCVQLDNNGSRHIRLLGVTVAGPNWQQTIQGGTVLAGAWKQWNFDLPAGHSPPASITAKTDQGTLSAELTSPEL
ncbi:MAG: fimbrial biogenesis chaperone [Methylomicrobium sp.]|jgi:fimbrial chaperone protein